MTNPIDAFREAMLAAGLSPPDHIAPGKVHRFPGIGKSKGNTDGWCLLFSDGMGGAFGDHSKPEIKGGWQAKTDRLQSKEEQAAFRRQIEQARKQAEETRKEEHAKAAIEAAPILGNATGDPAGHPYEILKGVPLGDKVRRGAWPKMGWSDALIIPLYDQAGKITTLQAINGDGQKDFLKGGKKKGSFYPIGKFSGITGRVLIGEGLATVAAAVHSTGLPGVVAIDAGNLHPVALVVRQLAPAAEIIIIADDDQKADGSNPGKEAATQAAKAVGGKVALPDLGKKADAWDVWKEQGPEAVKKMVETAHAPAPTNSQEPAADLKSGKRIVVIDLGAFLAREFPPRPNLLPPWLPAQGLAMVYAYRGIGKTHFALGVAYACASGGSFLGWQAPAPVGVLYIDGEMPGPTMQERLSAIIASQEEEATAPFLLLTPDLQPEGMPRIDTEEGQAAIDGILTEEIKLVVVDNISTLTSARENEADGWTPIQAWALRQRAVGRSILFVHHSGKGGAQRGTSRREDVLDTVIALRRPVDYQPDQGAVFEVHFEKARGIHGEDVKPIEATLTTNTDGVMTWATRTLEDSTFERVVELLNEGMTQKDISVELSINKSNVSRHTKKARQLGLISDHSGGGK